jgi:hypothetical protein
MFCKFTEIRPGFFSAGNPYLERDRQKWELGIQKQFKERFSIDFNAYTETAARMTNPRLGRGGEFSANYQYSAELPELLINYGLHYRKENSIERFTEVIKNDSIIDSLRRVYQFKDRNLIHIIGLESRHTLKNGLSYGLRFNSSTTDDISKHPDVHLMNSGDQYQYSINTWCSARLNKSLKNKVSLKISFKDENSDSLHGIAWKITDQVTYSIIPKVLSVQLDGEYSSRRESNYDIEKNSWNNPLYGSFYSTAAELRYNVNSSLTLNGRTKYEKSFDELPGSTENYHMFMVGMFCTTLF